MFKYRKFSEGLLISASVVSLFCATSVQAKKSSIMDDFVSVSPPQKLMSPVVPEDKTFRYGGMTSFQASPLSLKVLNQDFIDQMGGENKRAVGTAELLTLVHSQLGGTDIGKLSEQEKNIKAKAAMVSLLGDQPEEVIQQYKATGDLPREAINPIYQEIKGKIFGKLELKEEDVSEEEFLKGNEEVTSHTILSLGDENELPSVQQVNKLADEFEELVPSQAATLNSAGGPLESLVSKLESELAALKELEYKFATPAKPSGFFSYFKMSSWEKSKELMDKKRENYKKQITEVEDLIKAERKKLSSKSNLDETDLKLFEVNATRSIKGTLSYVAWAVDGQKVDPISQRIYESWMKGTTPAYKTR